MLRSWTVGVARARGGLWLQAGWWPIPEAAVGADPSTAAAGTGRHRREGMDFGRRDAGVGHRVEGRRHLLGFLSRSPGLIGDDHAVAGLARRQQGPRDALVKRRDPFYLGPQFGQRAGPEVAAEAGRQLHGDHPVGRALPGAVTFCPSQVMRPSMFVKLPRLSV